MTRSRLAAGLAAFTLVVVAGCGGSSDQPDTTTTTPTDVATTTAAATPPAPSPTAAPVSLKYTGGLTMEAPGGYKVQVTIGQGDIAPATPGLTNGSVTLGTACKTVRPQTDAAVPFSITVATQTPSNISVDYTVQWREKRGGTTGDPVPSRVKVEQEYVVGGSHKCVNEVNDVYTAATKSMASGGQMTINGFVIVRNFYSPQFPGGDTAAIKDDVLGVMQMIISNNKRMGSSAPTGTMRKVKQRTGMPYGVSVVPTLDAQNCNTDLSRICN